MLSVVDTAAGGVAAVVFSIMHQCSLCVGGREGRVFQCVVIGLCSHALLV